MAGHCTLTKRKELRRAGMQPSRPVRLNHHAGTGAPMLQDCRRVLPVSFAWFVSCHGIC